MPTVPTDEVTDFLVAHGSAAKLHQIQVPFFLLTAPKRSLSLSHTHTHTLSLSLSHTHSHTLTHTHSLTHIHTLSLSLSLTHTQGVRRRARVDPHQNFENLQETSKWFPDAYKAPNPGEEVLPFEPFVLEGRCFL